MSIWTKEEIQTQIQSYKEALLACSHGKSYTIGSRTLTRSDIPHIMNVLDYFERELNSLEGRPSSFVVQAKIHGKHRY